jgi:hypothetical protein
MNVEIGTEAHIPFLGIHKWDFHCSAPVHFVLYCFSDGCPENLVYKGIKWMIIFLKFKLKFSSRHFRSTVY